GAIFKRADGRWCAGVSLGVDVRGHRKRRWVYGATREEVRDMLSALQIQVRNGTSLEPAKIRVGDFLDEWLRGAVSSGAIRESTRVRYDCVIRLHIKPIIANEKLEKLNPMKVQRLYTVLQERGVPGRTREIVHAVLRRALQQAIAWRYI